MAAVPSIARPKTEARQGVASEFARSLCERHYDPIFRYCLYRLGSREEAEDAAQTTFLYAVRGLRRGVVPTVESAWLFKIAQNVCRSRMRSAGRRRRVETPRDLHALADALPAPEHDGDELVGLEQALTGMSESQRRAILLREWHGLSYREIAETLGMTGGAVETLIFRARRSLALALEGAAERRRRVVRALDVGSLSATLGSALAGGSGVKVVAAAAVATVAVATGVVGEPAVGRSSQPEAPIPLLADAAELRALAASTAQAQDPQLAGRPAIQRGTRERPRSTGKPPGTRARPAAESPAPASKGGETGAVGRGGVAGAETGGGSTSGETGGGSTSGETGGGSTSGEATGVDVPSVEVDAPSPPPAAPTPLDPVDVPSIEVDAPSRPRPAPTPLDPVSAEAEQTVDDTLSEVKSSAGAAIETVTDALP